jgi:hypothetical protein
VLGEAESLPLAERGVALHDGRIRALGIPFFGTVIPNATGLFGPLGPSAAAYWLGYAWFILLAALIWHGNRYFLIQQRRYYDWFDHPVRKVSLLLFANVFWTAPLTAAMIAAWYRLAGFPAVDWSALRLVVLVNVVCVVFVTHVYETVYLIQQREGDLVAVARLEQARSEAELQALKAQIDPHFLFNSLNVLSHLIPRDPARAVLFSEGLAETYRYILASRQRDLVPLAEELAFVEAYVGLLRLRFGAAVGLDAGELAAAGAPSAHLVPPISLQLLVENAVKHNALDAPEPLVVRLELDGDRVRVSNPLRPKSSARPSARVGLRNLDARCRRVLGRGLELRREEGRFVVAIPLLRTAA